VEVSVASRVEGKGFFLLFLGEAQSVEGIRHGETISYTLPAMTKGAVFWFEPQPGVEKAFNRGGR
jgi:hypothetical protein